MAGHHFISFTILKKKKEKSCIGQSFLGEPYQEKRKHLFE